MDLVSSTKAIIQNCGDVGFDALLTKVKSFCDAHNIDVPDMDAPYFVRRGRALQQQDEFTIKHHYRVNIFYAAIDFQLQELNLQFSESTVELLILSSSLHPRLSHESFKIDDICQLVEKFYPQDFTDQEKIQLRIQLNHYEHNVVRHKDFKELSTSSEMCQWLVRTRKSIVYQLVFRVIVLVLTLPSSTTTTERSFLAMSLIKIRLCSKMDDEFLTDPCLVYIEREIANKFSIESIIEDFQDLKERRIPF